MKLKAIHHAMIGAVALVLIPRAASATAATDTGTYEQQQEDDGFDWGLLGLLGLAGLLGLKKRDDRDVHVDNRR
jgi:hypothetical protein